MDLLMDAAKSNKTVSIQSTMGLSHGILHPRTRGLTSGIDFVFGIKKKMNKKSLRNSRTVAVL
jgi:hypothetical protein